MVFSPDFNPSSALAGGALIGVAAAGLLFLNGRIAGVSGILQNALAPQRFDFGWRVVFLAGLFLGGALGAILLPSAALAHSIAAPPIIAIAGLLVGIGTAYAGGCTSGHGVCGLARRSMRSLIATVTFMLAGGVTVFVVRHIFGAGG